MLHLRILTVEKTIFEDTTVEEVVVPTTSGMIGVHGDHAPLVSIIKTGEILVKKANETIPFVISSGILEVRPHSQVIVLANSSEDVRSISVDEAEKAFNQAQKALADQGVVMDIGMVEQEKQISMATTRTRDEESLSELKEQLRLKAARLKSARRWRK